MLVTILTVAFNSEKTIAKTIESVLNQTYGDIEYIIVDGASTDNTVSVAESYKEAFEQTGGKTLTVISEPDRGMYDALNKGARLSHGELVGQVNSDDWYEPNAVETMVELYRTENYDVAWGSINMVQENRVWIKHAKIGRLWVSTGWCHPAMFSKREVLIEHPYPIETMYDDWDYITAVHIAGKKIITNDKVITNFAFGTGGISTKHSLREVRKRINISYSIYRKYGMSKFYWFYRCGFEMTKFLLGK